MKGIVGKVVEFAASLRAATSEIHNLIAERRAAIAGKRAELQRVARDPLPPAEVVEKFNAWVDQLAEYQRTEYGRGLVCFRFGAPPGSDAGGAPWAPGTELSWGFAALFLGDALKAGFGELVRSVEYDAGPPAVDRPARIARLTAELEALETEEERLVDEAAASGVAIAHRPEVLERRELEARRRELAAREAERQRAQEAAINTRHQRQATGGIPSPYLERDKARGQ